MLLPHARDVFPELILGVGTSLFQVTLELKDGAAKDCIRAAAFELAGFIHNFKAVSAPRCISRTSGTPGNSSPSRVLKCSRFPVSLPTSLIERINRSRVCSALGLPKICKVLPYQSNLEKLSLMHCMQRSGSMAEPRP